MMFTKKYPEVTEMDAEIGESSLVYHVSWLASTITFVSVKSVAS